MPGPASTPGDPADTPPDRSATQLWTSAQEAFGLRDYAAAADLLERLIADHDGEAPLNMATVRLLHGVTLLRLRRTAEALPHLHIAAELAPLNARAHQKLGAGIARMGREDEALPHLERAAALAADNAEYQWRLGEQYRRLGRKTEAKAAFERSLTLEPGYGPATDGLAALARRPGSWLARLAWSVVDKGQD